MCYLFDSEARAKWKLFSKRNLQLLQMEAADRIRALDLRRTVKRLEVHDTVPGKMCNRNSKGLWKPKMENSSDG
jgi:hypothetical protein